MVDKYSVAISRSQWPRGLRRRSAAAHLLGLQVRIPPEAWRSLSCECCVLSGGVLCVGLTTRPEGVLPSVVCLSVIVNSVIGLIAQRCRQLITREISDRSPAQWDLYIFAIHRLICLLSNSVNWVGLVPDSVHGKSYLPSPGLFAQALCSTVEMRMVSISLIYMNEAISV